jgi:hypothetical protein
VDRPAVSRPQSFHDPAAFPVLEHRKCGGIKKTPSMGTVDSWCRAVQNLRDHGASRSGPRLRSRLPGLLNVLDQHSLINVSLSRFLDLGFLMKER